MARIQILELPRGDDQYATHETGPSTIPFAFVIDQMSKEEGRLFELHSETWGAFAKVCGARGTITFSGTLDIF